NLGREWIQYRHRRFDGEEARARGEHKVQLEQLYGQVRALGVIRQQFARILYPFEVNDIEYKVASLARQITEVAAQVGDPPAKLDLLLERYKLKERVVELLKVKFQDRVIRVRTPPGEQFGAPANDPTTLSAGAPDPKLVDIAAAALTESPEQRDLESG